MGDGGENDTRRKLTENPFSGDFNQLPADSSGGNTADRLRNNEQFDRSYNQVADRGAQPQDGNPLFDDAYQRQEVPRNMDRRPEIPAHIERYLDPRGNNVINVYYINANRVEIGNQRDAGRPYVDPAVYERSNWESHNPRVRVSNDRYVGPRDLYGDYYNQATRNPQGRYEVAGRYEPVSYEPQVRVNQTRDRVSGGQWGYEADRSRTTVNTGGRGYDDYGDYRTPPYVPDGRSAQQGFDNFLRILDVGASIYGISQAGRHGGRYGGQDPRYGGYDPRYGGYDPRYGGYDPRYGGYDPRYGGYDPRYGGQGNGSIYVETRGGNANVRRDRDRVSGGPGGYSADRERTRVSTGNGGYDGYEGSGQQNFDNVMRVVDVGAAIFGISQAGRGNRGGDYGHSNYYNQGRPQYGRGANFEQRYAQQAHRAYGYRQG